MCQICQSNVRKRQENTTVAADFRQIPAVTAMSDYKESITTSLHQQVPVSCHPQRGLKEREIQGVLQLLQPDTADACRLQMPVAFRHGPLSQCMDSSILYIEESMPRVNEWLNPPHSMLIRVYRRRSFLDYGMDDHDRLNACADR